YGGARAALAALPDLARRGGASRATRVHSRQDAERELKAAKALGVAFVALGEPDYPPPLQMIDDAPPLLAVRGQTAVLHLPARPMPRPRGCVSPSGWRAISAPRALPSSPASRAASTPPPIARASPPAPSPCSRAATTISIRANTPTLPTPSWRKAPWSRKCR